MRANAARQVLLASAAGALVVAWTAPAAATDPYWMLFGGLNHATPTDLSSPNAIGNWPFYAYPRTLRFDPGGVLGIAVGKTMGPMRGEAELSYRFNGLGNITIQGEGVVPGSGSVRVLAAMVNGWFDLPGHDGFTPYVGGGIGAAHLHLTPSEPPGGFGYWLDVDERRWALAFQLGAGLKFGMRSGGTLSLDYRYFGTSRIALSPLSNYGDGYGSVRYRAHSVMLGWTKPIGGP
jgi:opacity protein-like surface antigen